MLWVNESARVRTLHMHKLRNPTMRIDTVCSTVLGWACVQEDAARGAHMFIIWFHKNCCQEMFAERSLAQSRPCQNCYEGHLLSSLCASVVVNLESCGSLSMVRKQTHVLRSSSGRLFSTRASLATLTMPVSWMSNDIFECACYECMVKPELVTQVHARLTYALMHLVRLVCTVLWPLCSEFCGTWALMCGLALHTVSCS